MPLLSMLRLLRRATLSGPLLLALLLLASIQVNAAAAVPGTASRPIAKASANLAPVNPEAARLRQMIHTGQLAPSVQVLSSLPPTTIVQFPLVPSGLKTAFPNAKALVTVVRGDRDNSTSDIVTVDVQNMPPNITFTIFLIELANKPFGNVEYVADLTTRGDGSGETIFNVITLVAFSMDARNPGTSRDGVEGATSGINLEHMGMWFSSLQDAQKVLNDTTLKGTIFDGGSPPLHAGPQAMTDGQTAPVI
ncbi:MAG TPA: hypothetical protein VFQ30_08895 [Ktedonobacteraceae bacterium]|nr:hypothetical protein [Ktedonobacteraceae bacterium]